MSEQTERSRGSSKTENTRKSVLEQIRTGVSEYRFEYAMLLPTLLLLITILWLPFLRGIWMSFHEWPFFGEKNWIGSGNYQYLFQWSAFYTSLRVTFIYGLTVIGQLALAIAAALTLKHQTRFKDFLGSLLIIPYTLPSVVTGTIWIYILNPDFGPFFKFMEQLGTTNGPIYWSTVGSQALAVISFVGIWSFWPFMFVIIYASVENINEEYYESAKVYKATRYQMFRNVTLPQIKSSILVALIIRTIWNLSKVSQPLQMTGGGPSYETSLLAILLYNEASTNGNLGLSYSIGIILLIGTLALIVVFVREFEQSTEEI